MSSLSAVMPTVGVASGKHRCFMYVAFKGTPVFENNFGLTILDIILCLRTRKTAVSILVQIACKLITIMNPGGGGGGGQSRRPDLYFM